MLYNLTTFFCRAWLRIFFRLKISGMENIPRRGGFILASNHMSNLDPIVVSSSCPRQVHFMAKEELFRNKLFGWYIARLNAFPVKRASADLSAIKQAIRRVGRGGGLLLFPEGTRQPEGRLGAPQEGVGFLAATLQVPVVPVFVRGTGVALPPGASKVKVHPIRVWFGRQRLVERGMPHQAIADLIMEDIRQLSCLKSS